MKKEYHWHLASASEMKSILESNRCKCICPQCGYKSYKYYVNNEGHILDEYCGKCDRENSCQYHMTPSQWLKDHPEGKSADAVAKRLPPRPQKEPYCIPISYIEAKRKGNITNNLICHLKSLAWDKKQRAMLDAMIAVYGVGTGHKGETIWWQIDDNLKIRSGKIMRYLADGHRDKQHFGTWVHSKMEQAGMLDPKKGEYVGCLFGQHLLKAYSNTPEVAIVESEKTALICSSYFCDWEKRIWMATAGKGNLNYLKLLPIIQSGKKIVLYPDHDAFDDWSAKANEIGHCIKVSRWVEKNFDQELDKDNADIADILIRRLEKQPTTAEKVIKTLNRQDKADFITNLCETFNLSIVDEQRSKL